MKCRGRGACLCSALGGERGIENMAKKALKRKRRRQKKIQPRAPLISKFARRPKKEARRVLTISKKTTKPAVAPKTPFKRANTPGKKPIPKNPIPVEAVFVDRSELPVRYGKTGVTLIPRDPFSVYAYWEITPSSLQEARLKLGRSFAKAIKTLRMFDVTGIDFNGVNANSRFDVDVDPKAQNRYIVLPNDNATLCVDLGFRAPGGAFYSVARSNAISTPSANMSDQSEITWAKVRHKQGAKPYVVAQSIAPAIEHKNIDWASKGPGQDRDSAGTPTPENAAPVDSVAVQAKRRVKEPGTALIFEYPLDSNTMHASAEIEIASSFAMRPSGASGEHEKADIAPVSSEEVIKAGASERMPRQRDFFFQLDAELIVYGRTEPGALVTMDGHSMELREDGTFTQRLALPEGVLPLAFSARPVDAGEEKTITLRVGRTTTVHP
jgi:uncharacterized protein